MSATYQVKYHGGAVAVTVAGSGTRSILFLHGNSMSAETWNAQLKDTHLLTTYKLFAIDLPGHGKSEWSQDAGLYRPRALSALINIMVNYFVIEDFIIVGLSYGTSIIAEIETHASGCRGLFLASPCILNDEYPPSLVITPGPFGHVIVSEFPDVNDLQAFIDYVIYDPHIAAKFKQTYADTDPRFRKELGLALQDNDISDQLSNISQSGLLVAIVFGNQDRLLNAHYLDNFEPKWKGEVIRVPEAAHVVNEENPVAFNQILDEFASMAFM